MSFNLNIFGDQGSLQWRHEMFKTAAMTSANGYGTGTKTLFTVTGDVLLRNFLAICRTSLEGAATVEVGVTGATPYLLSQLSATTLDANEIWVGATAATPTILEIPAADALEIILPAGLDILLTIASTALTAGVVDFHCFWYPLSAGSSVVTA